MKPLTQMKSWNNKWRKILPTAVCFVLNFPNKEAKERGPSFLLMGVGLTACVIAFFTIAWYSFVISFSALARSFLDLFCSTTLHITTMLVIHVRSKQIYMSHVAHNPRG